ALKSTSGWKGYGYAGENGTNDYGWNGLPGGNRTSSGGFYYVGYKGYWWSSSQYDAGNAWNRVFSFGVDNVLSYDSNKENGFYVRCIRD
ncbi:MAG: hypothetical protein CMP67_10045, partial [Flavobacteriales bacterium]|nr:hypothetical protein [Flavobacteriales bacterium]